jgi:hypothetical protein
MGKYQLKIDTANLADGDSIASYLVDGAGNLLSSTLVSGKQSLDVNVTQSALPSGAATEATLASLLSELQSLTYLDGAAWSAGSTGSMPLAVRKDASGPLSGVDDGDFSPLQVDADGALKVSGSIAVDFSYDFAEDSAHTSGDIGAFTLAVRRDARTSGTSADGDYASFNVNGVGELWVHDEDVKAELVLANASLDAIEASAAAIESDVDAIRVELLDQGLSLDSIVTNTSSISSSVSGLSKLEDSAHSSGDAGIQALAVRKDGFGSNVSADGDYASLQVWSEGSLKIVNHANGSIKQQQVGVTNTAAEVTGSAPLANRRSLLIQNTGGSKVWIGSSTVTTSGATAGLELSSGSFLELDVGPLVPIFAIKGSGGSSNINILEMA